jgi:hypothetical protein
MQQKKKLSPEERAELHKKLANEFVKSKMGKQSYLVQLYQLLQYTFVDLIMLKNKKEELEQLKQSLAEGSVAVPSELETLMTVESREIIQDHFADLKGDAELYRVQYKKN